MCGFVVVFSSNSKVNTDTFKAQLGVIERRGPDDFGLYSPVDNLFLGSRRLAIQDVTNSGHMPMVSRDGKVSLVYNGEIYNFKIIRDRLTKLGYSFLGGSDTEVVLNAYIEWGRGCLEVFDGMFSFVICDFRNPNDPQLFLARDRVGEKPLYWYMYGGHLIICSELSSITVDPEAKREISIDALNLYFGLGYIPAPFTLLRHAHKLESSHYAVIKLNSLSMSIDRYWQPPACLRKTEKSLGQCASEVFELLKNSVSDRLIADVPVGVFLSGGLDSSLITAAAAEVASHKIQTFTISFPGFQVYDESGYADHISKHFGTEHNCISFSDKELLGEMIHIMDSIDEPIGDSSILPTALLCRITRNKATVALGGDGGDELFGGYSSYGKIFQGQQSIFASALSKFGRSCGRRLPLGFRGRTFFDSLGWRDEQWFSSTSMIFNNIDRSRLFSGRVGRVKDFLLPEAYKLKYWSTECAPAEAAMRADFFTYLPYDILTKVDRASMAHSLEVRSPFLSKKIIDYAFSELPVHYKVSSSSSKVILKEIARKHLPADFSFDRKQGFSIPPSLYNSSSWVDLVSDSIGYLPEDVFNLQYIEKLSKSGSARQTLNSYMFPLIVLAGWLRRYGI
jgi:asparagine synthase (glutamine-hydrolysing)